jgi:hypothetical protein
MAVSASSPASKLVSAPPAGATIAAVLGSAHPAPSSGASGMLI